MLSVILIENKNLLSNINLENCITTANFTKKNIQENAILWANMCKSKYEILKKIVELLTIR